MTDSEKLDMILTDLNDLRNRINVIEKHDPNDKPFGNQKIDYMDNLRRMYGMSNDTSKQAIFERAKDNHYKSNNIAVNNKMTIKFFDCIASPEVAEFDEYSKEIIEITSQYFNIVNKQSLSLKDENDANKLYIKAKECIGRINEMAMHLKKSEYMIGGYVFGGKDREVNIGFDKNVNLFFTIWAMIPDSVKKDLHDLIKTTIKKMVNKNAV